ncbi:MAG: shikimate dehydrogenase [Thermoleophilaceae bacterium]|nr:shikimate dehydrogenase [Thermoleophilaceae bacterium]
MAVEAAAPMRFGVTGYPVAHSRSPAMHEAAYRVLGVDAEYQLLPIPPELFEETVRALPGSGFHGINVTIPHKHAAAEMADEVSPTVEAVGAANTLTFEGGRILAENTDAPGMMSAIARPVQKLRTLVLGAGGTARAAAWALQDAGAEVSVYNRTTERAAKLADDLGVALVLDPAGGSDFEVVVNTTSVGMDEGTSEEEALLALGLDLESVSSSAVVVDFVYRAGGSPLTSAAKAAGLTVIDGNELLARQGALSFEIWFDRPAPLDVMRAALA